MGDINDIVPPPSMSESTARAVSISTQVMIATVIVLFFIVAFCFFLHLYVKCFWIHNNEDANIVSWRRQLANQRRSSSARAHRRGLDPAALQSLPIVEYNPKDFKDGLECAVCLSDVSEGEKARLLPKCNHGFHVECIDMWFQSHSTCPLCRDSVISTNDSNNNLQVQDDHDVYYSSDSNSDFDDGSNYASPRPIDDTPVLPTNVLFWGNETQVSTFGQSATASSSSASSSGVSRPRGDEMVIDIPSRDFCEDCSSSPPRVEEAKTPVMTRLRSLRRLLSMGKRVAPSTCDVGQQV